MAALLSMLPSGVIEHTLHTSLLGEAVVLVPDHWPAEYGFILRVGRLDRTPLVRIQSRCAYGEVFGSVHCDCGAQLHESASRIRAEGGLLVYLEQEGRGAGISAKAAAYQAAERDLVDTFTHYESSGRPADLRSYAETAAALIELGASSVRLLTNNPDKVKALRAAGIDVTRLPLVVPIDPRADPYIVAKRQRGHLL